MKRPYVIRTHAQGRAGGGLDDERRGDVDLPDDRPGCRVCGAADASRSVPADNE